MTNTLVRGLGGPGSAGGPLGKRSVHILSDGSWLSVVADNNKSGVTGATGDGTNVPKIYAYRSTDDGATWTLVATQPTSIPVTGYVQYSSAIDSSDNINIIWIDGSSASVKWNKFTFGTGYSYTAGTVTTVWTAVSGFTPIRVDVDTFANGQCVVGVFEYHQASGSTQGVKSGIYILSATGAVVYTKETVLIAGKDNKTGSDDITVSATHDPVVGNMGIWCAITASTPATGTDTGDVLSFGIVNLSTGVESNYSQKNLTTSSYNYRRYTLFCTDGARSFVYGLMTAGTGAVFGYQSFSLGSTSGISFSHSLLTRVFQTATPVRVPDIPGAGGYYTVAMQYLNNASGLLTFAYSSNANTNVYTVTVSTSTGTFRNVWLNTDQGQTQTVGALTCISGGGNRNFTLGKVAFLAHYAKLGYQARFLSPPPPSTPAAVKPNSGAVVQTGLPSYGAQVKEPYPVPGGTVQLVWRIAKDAGMTTSLIVIPSNNFFVPYNVDPSSPPSSVTEVFIPNSLLFEASTGVWYVQAYELDEWGRTSAASTPTSFTVLHRPTAANLSPAGGVVVAYGTGVIFFSWQFTDPYVNDNQSAFQLQITDGSGSAVFDSGVVTSTAQLASVAIPSGYKDVPLFWQVYLYDKDGTVGPASLQAFQVSDAPAPTITNPVAGQNLTSGTSTITWTDGIASPRTQSFYSIKIVDSQNNVVFSYEVAGDTSLSFQLPTGTLHNAQSYAMYLTVEDSNDLSTTVGPVPFTTAWTPPAQADLVRLYLAKYATDGYLFVGWTSVNIDPNFIQWNLYRRALGDTTWVNIETRSDIQSAYGYQDYDVRAGVLYQYCVTQLINNSGDTIESNLTPQAAIAVPSTSYWLIDPFGIQESVPIFSVTADSYAEESESAVYTIIGSGRHVDEGDILGKSGTLTVEFWDKAVNLVTSINYFLNPSFQAQSQVNTPDNWTVGSIGSAGSVTTDNITFYEPAPNGKISNLVIRSSALGGTSGDAITYSQAVSFSNLPCTPGQTFDHSEWITPEIVAGNVQSVPTIKSVAQYYDSTNTLISTETILGLPVDVYETPSNGDTNTGSWKRFKMSHIMPSTTDHMIVTTTASISTAGAYGLILGGAQLEEEMTTFFDGDMRGCNWLNGQYISGSFTNGYYSAADQREDVLAMRYLGRPITLKTPFGQSLLVKIGTGGTNSSGASGPQVDRVAGTPAEFTTMSLTYVEVAF